MARAILRAAGSEQQSRAASGRSRARGRTHANATIRRYTAPAEEVHEKGRVPHESGAHTPRTAGQNVFRPTRVLTQLPGPGELSSTSPSPTPPDPLAERGPPPTTRACHALSRTVLAAVRCPRTPPHRGRACGTARLDHELTIRGVARFASLAGMAQRPRLRPDLGLTSDAMSHPVEWERP